MSEMPSQAEIQEATASHIQELELALEEAKNRQRLSDLNFDNLDRVYSATLSKLTASEEARKKAEDLADKFKWQVIDTCKRAEAAEQRINESQKQEPVAYGGIGSSGDYCRISFSDCDPNCMEPLYPHPIIPPSHEELQRENAELQRRVAELEKDARRYQWQPIETAPRDGTNFLAIVEDSVRVVAFTKTSHVPIYGFCTIDQGPEDVDICHMTAWMQMPSAIAKEQGK